MSEKNLITRDQENLVVEGAVPENLRKVNQSNNAWISGKIEDELEYSHKVFGVKFYKTRVEVVRLSGTIDFVPIIISELLLEEILNTSLKGKFVEVGGQYRSHNKWGNDGCRHLELFLFVSNMTIYESKEIYEKLVNNNLIFLDGYICKKPILRITPSGKIIADIMIAVNRSNHKSDYIPCIDWEENALDVAEMEIGDRINLKGRIQSREYLKKDTPDSEKGEVKVAYEVSIGKMNKVAKCLE